MTTARDGRSGKELTKAEKMERHNAHQAYAEEVAAMFARGESFRAIERATGIPKSTAEHMCKRLSGEYVAQRYGDRMAVLGRELQILDALTRKNLKRATEGDATSAAIVMNAHIRRSKLLGLDAAVSVALTVKTAQDIEIERLVSQLRANDPSDLYADHEAGPAGGSE